MNRELKSLAYTLGILLIYYWASKGMVKLLMNVKNQNMFDARVRLLNYSLVLSSLVFIIGIYHIVGPYHTEAFYKMFIIAHFIYLVLGNFVNSLIKN
jgi:hypothetical protein